MSVPLRAYWASGERRRRDRFIYLAPPEGGPGRALLFIRPVPLGDFLEHKFLLRYTLFVDGTFAILDENDFIAPLAVNLFMAQAAPNVFFDAVLESSDCPDVLRDLIAQVEWF